MAIQAHKLQRGSRRYGINDYTSIVFPLFSQYLVNQWLGNGNLNDSWGSNPLVSDNSVTFATGKNLVDQCFSFNGSNWGYANNSYSNLGSLAGFSLSFWFKTTSALGGGFDSFQTTQTSTSGLRSYPAFMQNNGTVGFGYFSGGARLAISSGTFNDGNWHFAVTTLSDSNGSILYIDNNNVASNGTSGGVSNWAYSPSYWRVGNGDFAGAWGYTATNPGISGSVQDFRFYNVVLNSTQVGQLYTAGAM